MAIRTAVGIGAGLLFLALTLYSLWTALLMVLVIHACVQYEFLRLRPQLSRDVAAVHHGLSTLAVATLSLSLAGVLHGGWAVLAVSAALLFCALHSIVRYERQGEGGGDVHLLRAFAFITLPLACVLPLCVHAERFPYLLLLIGAGWGADTGAMWAGRLIGRRPLCPRLSPKKTVEGIIGGMLAAGAVWAGAGLLYPLPHLIAALGLSPTPTALGALHSAALGPPTALAAAALFLLGMAVAAIGAAGDLLFSLFKREAGVKDYGALLPGHGGMLDRCDSLLFAAPFVYLLSLL